MKPPPISENEGKQSSVSSKKEPESKSASVKDITVNNEKSEHLLENNIETKNLRIPKKQSMQTKINSSLQPDGDTYELEKFKKNAMIIFNHEYFLDGDRRLGTDLDVAALEDTFKQFRFAVTTRNDLTQQELFDELKQFSKKNFNDYGCICVAILTHGQDGGFLRAYDTRYRERDVFSCFDALANHTLVAKPIIFLIQACRGSTAAARVPNGRVQNVVFDADTSENGYRPTEADMIIFHSSFFGRASIRVVEEGSWFIQTVCEQIKLHGSTDHLEKLFCRVRRIVALDKEYEGVKQMPVVTTTLLKKLYLKKIDDTKITVECESDCRDDTYQPVDLNLGCERAHIAYNGCSTPKDTYNGGSAPADTYNGGSAPDKTYNGGSAPDDTHNGGSAPEDTHIGGSAPDDTQNGGSAPDDTPNGGSAPEDTHNSSSAPDDTYNGGSAPEDTHNRRSAPKDTYNGGSVPEDTQNGGSAPEDTHNGGFAPDDTYNGSSAPDDPYEENDGSNSETVTSIDRTYRRRRKIEKFLKVLAAVLGPVADAMNTPEYRLNMMFNNCNIGQSNLKSIYD